MPYATYSPEEVESRGEALYRERIQAAVEPQHLGKFLVIDVETGLYEIADDDLEATKRLLAKRPEAILYGLRVGHDAAYRLGGHALSTL